MPDKEQAQVTIKENDDGERVSYIYPASAIIGALEIEQKDEEADDESK